MTQDQIYSREGSSGSPAHGEPEFLVVGKLRRPHGLRGDILMSVLTDFPERLVPENRFYVGEDHQLLNVREVHWHGKNVLIAFEGYTDRESVGIFRNQMLSVRLDELPSLEDGEMYQHQMLGLKVIQDVDNVLLGTVEKIIETGGANDVMLVIAEDGTELLLPDIDSVVLDIDIDRKEMRVHVLPGLLPEK